MEFYTYINRVKVEDPCQNVRVELKHKLETGE